MTGEPNVKPFSEIEIGDQFWAGSGCVARYTKLDGKFAEHVAARPGDRIRSEFEPGERVRVAKDRV